MTTTDSTLADLPLFAQQARSPVVSVIDEIATKRNVEWFVTALAGRDWTTAKVICGEIGWAPSENNKRRLRKLADASGGRVAGHQKGYKLVREMTKEEFTWWENEQLKMSDALRSRVIESRRVFYAGAATGM